MCTNGHYYISFKREFSKLMKEIARKLKLELKLDISLVQFLSFQIYE